MNKLLQTTLITAVLSTAAWAETEESALATIPMTIDAGAIVYIDTDYPIDTGGSVTIDNYGTIGTGCRGGEGDPYPTLSGNDSIINNHGGLVAKEETETDAATGIKNANIVKNADSENVELDKVCKIIKEEKGTIDSNIKIDGITVIHGTNEIKTKDLATYTDSDLLYLGAEGLAEEADKTVIIRGGDMESSSEGTINCNLGSKGSDTPYNIEIREAVKIDGNISNYTNGSITVKNDEGEANTSLIFGDTTKKELHVPLTAEDSMVYFQGNADIYSKIDSIDASTLFGKNTRLKSGATFTIRAKTDSTNE